MSTQYIFYDLPSKDPCKCWSLNPWKTRLLLNYKNLPYETKWVEYPDIKPLLEEHVPPNERATPYTIPAIQFADGTWLQDSRKIAERIEKEHPNPSVHLRSEQLLKLEGLMNQLLPVISPDFIPKVFARLLNEASIPYWRQTREARFGMPLDQVEREQGGDTAWMNAAPTVQEVTKMLKEKSNGPYFDGDQVTYVDFVWAGFLKFLHRIGDDIYNRALEVSGDRTVHEALLKACDPWLARDGH